MSKGKLLAVCLVWLTLFGAGAVAWKYYIAPKKQEQAEKEKDERIGVGSTRSRYKHNISLAIDAFSGYAILRSSEFEKELASRSIKITPKDDNADYAARLAKLQSGDVQMAVFTIDALLKTCANADDLPGTIVAIIDETRGADAIVGYKSKFNSVDDFNDPGVKFVLTPDSPSETLARVVMSTYDLPNLSQDNMIRVGSAKEVYERFLSARPDAPELYVLWEPYVSKMLENEEVNTIVSSKDLFGYIVDVLVVRKEFLAKPGNEKVVKDVVESYFTAAYQYRGKMEELMLSDSKITKEPLAADQAKSLADGIDWKDTQQNYGHFGLSGSRTQHIEDMIGKISRVLLSTNAISQDPTNDRPNLLFYDAILKQLMDSDFHPAIGAIEGGEEGPVDLRALSDSEWQSLKPVGTLKVDKLYFARGGSALLDSSRRSLDDLVGTLSTHNHYLTIRGTATRAGDLELNKQLAADRAQAAADYLIRLGISKNRIRSEGVIGNTSSVSFLFGQLPF